MDARAFVGGFTTREANEQLAFRAARLDLLSNRGQIDFGLCRPSFLAQRRIAGLAARTHPFVISESRQGSSFMDAEIQQCVEEFGAENFAHLFGSQRSPTVAAKVNGFFEAFFHICRHHIGEAARTHVVPAVDDLPGGLCRCVTCAAFLHFPRWAFFGFRNVFLEAVPHMLSKLCGYAFCVTFWAH